MKPGFGIGTLLLLAVTLSSQPAISQQGPRAAPPAAKKKQHIRPAIVPAAQPVVHGWRPADPSFDQQGRRYQPPRGLACLRDTRVLGIADCEIVATTCGPNTNGHLARIT